MSKVQISPILEQRLSQGSVFRNVECIEYAIEKQGIIEVSKIEFPLIIVLTQDCDLAQDFKYKDPTASPPKTQDKKLLSVLVAPLYNSDHVLSGTHLSDLNLNMQKIDSKTHKDIMKRNQIPRYHYLEFPEELAVVPQMIDFKHYFSLNINYLEQLKNNNYVCQIAELYREDISHRFASYLSRIGLPDLAS